MFLEKSIFFLKSKSLITFIYSLIKGANNEGAEGNNPTNEIQQSQPVFPAALSSTVLCLVDILFDQSLNSKSQSSNLIKIFKSPV